MFFKDLQLNSMQSLLSFRNADEWLNWLHQILYNIDEV
jgi:hypothetical protein